jgi:hypothetical protein
MRGTTKDKFKYDGGSFDVGKFFGGSPMKTKTARYDGGYLI